MEEGGAESSSSRKKSYVTLITDENERPLACRFIVRGVAWEKNVQALFFLSNVWVKMRYVYI